MIPDHLLLQLQPSAAKLYLILLELQSRQLRRNAPVTASLSDLSRLSGYCVATCKTALHQLISLNLLTRLPRQYHAASTYQFRDPAKTNSQSAGPYTPTNSHPASSYSPPNSQPISSLIPTNSQPISSLIPSSRPSTPIGASKSPNSQPTGSLFNQMLALLADPTDSASTDTVRSLYLKLTPEEQQLALAFAQAQLPKPQEAHA